MNRTRCWLAGLLVVLAAIPGQAGEFYDLETGRELAIGGSVLATGLLVWQRAGRVQPLTADDLAALDPADVPAFDRIATRCWSPGAAHLSDLLRTGLSLAPLALLADTGPEMSGGELLVMYLESLAVSQTLTGALKLSAGRLRPLAYNPDPRIPDELRRSPYGRRSIPSGHTSAAFTGALFTSEVYARLHPERTARHWVRGGAIALAATTGYLRVRAGHHFPSDVLAGAVVGALAGWAVPRLHERDPDPTRLETPAAADTPMLAFRLSF